MITSIIFRASSGARFFSRLGFVFCVAGLTFSIAYADPTTSDLEECLRGSRLPPIPHNRQRLSRADRVELGVTQDRGKQLANAYRSVETALREAGHEPNMLADEVRFWSAILREDSLLIAVYEAQDGAVVRTDAFGVGDFLPLVPRLSLAERALAATPSDCGTSFGVLDIGIESEGGAKLLYSISLVDRTKQVAWGIHYRFSEFNGELLHAERLHVQCHRRDVVTIEELFASAGLDLPPGGPRPQDAQRFVTRDSVPDRDLPTEMHAFQLHLSGGLPLSIEFWMRDKVFRVTAGETSIPDRFTRYSNPCSVAPADG